MNKKNDLQADDQKTKKDSMVTAPSFSTRLVLLADKIQTKRNAFLADQDLLPGYDNFLIALKSANGMTMGALATLINISPSSATKIATKLEAQGLLFREPSRIDSRQNHAFLTSKGETVVMDILAYFENLDADLVSKLKSKDTERAFKIFDRLESQNDSAGKKPKKAGKKKSRNKSANTKKNKKN